MVWPSILFPATLTIVARSISILQYATVPIITCANEHCEPECCLGLPKCGAGRATHQMRYFKNRLHSYNHIIIDLRLFNYSNESLKANITYL